MLAPTSFTRSSGATPRVAVMERTDIRSLTPAEIGGQVDMVVGDMSFISLRLVLPTLVGLLDPTGDLLVLIKPQFEAGRAEAARGRGVVRDPQVWSRVILEVSDAAMSVGAAMLGVMRSPITGSAGNVEFMALFSVQPGVPTQPSPPELPAGFEDAVGVAR